MNAWRARRWQGRLPALQSITWDDGPLAHVSRNPTVTRQCANLRQWQQAVHRDDRALSSYCPNAFDASPAAGLVSHARSPGCSVPVTWKADARWPMSAFAPQARRGRRRNHLDHRDACVCRRRRHLDHRDACVRRRTNPLEQMQRDDGRPARGTSGCTNTATPAPPAALSAYSRPAQRTQRPWASSSGVETSMHRRTAVIGCHAPCARGSPDIYVCRAPLVLDANLLCERSLNARLSFLFDFCLLLQLCWTALPLGFSSA